MLTVFVLKENKWSKSAIYTLCVPLGPKKDATVNSLFRSLESCFVSQKFDHQPRMPWTKTRMSATALRMETTRYKDPGRWGRRCYKEPCSRARAMNWISNLLDVDSEWFAMYALTCIFWAILGTKMINNELQHCNNWCIQKQILHF